VVPDVFALAVYETIPASEPDAPEMIVSQPAELLVVQEQPVAAATEMVPELPAAGLSMALVDTAYVQGLIKIATPLPPLPPARVALE
jgi:hypothetical protein